MEVQSPDPLGWIAPEIHPVRRFFAKFMLAAPALMTLAVTVQSKPTALPTTPKPERQELNRRIDAYVPVMALTVKELGEDFDATDPGRLRKCASLWIREAHAGKIQKLGLYDYSDQITDGVTGQVVKAALSVSRALSEHALREAKAGQGSVAAHDALLGMQLVQILQYSDTTMNSMASLRIRQGLEAIRTAAPKLAPEERNRLAIELKSFKTDPKKFEAFTLELFDLYRKGLAERKLLEEETGENLGSTEMPLRSKVLALLKPLSGTEEKRESTTWEDPFLTCITRSVGQALSTERDVERTVAVLGQA